MEIVSYLYLVRAETMIDRLYRRFDHVTYTHDEGVFIPMINLSDFQRDIAWMSIGMGSRLTVHFARREAVLEVIGSVNYKKSVSYSKVCS